MIDDLLTERPRLVLDVGCGTGITTRLFSERGCEVLGIEPDPRMAAVARRRGATVEDGSFEEWDARGRLFDLLVAGQSWHWVDPVSYTHLDVYKRQHRTRPTRRVPASWWPTRWSI